MRCLNPTSKSKTAPVYIVSFRTQVRSLHEHLITLIMKTSKNVDFPMQCIYTYCC